MIWKNITVILLLAFSLGASSTYAAEASRVTPSTPITVTGASTNFFQDGGQQTVSSVIQAVNTFGSMSISLILEGISNSGKMAMQKYLSLKENLTSDEQALLVALNAELDSEG